MSEQVRKHLRCRDHPEWFNVYRKLRADLNTHLIGGALSDLDLALARKVEALYARSGAHS